MNDLTVDELWDIHAGLETQISKRDGAALLLEVDRLCLLQEKVRNEIADRASAGRVAALAEVDEELSNG